MPRSAIPRKSAKYICAIGLVATVAACSSGGSTSANTGTSTQTTSKATGASQVRIQVYPGTIWSVPVYAAQSEGFFAKHGLHATLVPENTGPAAIAALASGSVDMSFVSPEIVMGAVGKGLAAKVVGGTMANPWVILVSKGVNIPTGTYPRTLKALKGLTVGVPTIPSAGQAVLEASMGVAGVDPKSVHATPVGLGATALAALKTGQIKALITQEPTGQEAVAKFGAKVLADPRKGEIPNSLKGPYIGEWVPNKLIKSDPVKVKDIKAALADATTWLAKPANVSAVASLLKKTYNVPGLDYQAMARGDQSLWTSDYTEENLKTWVNYDVKYGFLKTSVPVTNLVWPPKS